jgi:polyribonucleotide nucleotidyltransferase
VDDDGTVVVSGTSEDDMDGAMNAVDLIVNDPVVGTTYKSQVVRIMDFGAFVAIAPGREGLVHISQLAYERVNKVDDMLKIGDDLEVKLMEIDDMGRLNFSHKVLLPKPEGYTEPARNERSGSSGGRGRRPGGPRGGNRRR